MKKIFHTDGKPAAVQLDLASPGRTRVYIVARDPRNPQNEYTNRFVEVNGRQRVWIRIPVAPENVELRLADDASLNNQPPQFRAKAKLVPLRQKRSALLGRSRRARSFVRFAEEFLLHLPYLSPGVYTSDDGQFTIRLMEEIESGGKVLATPARISKRSGTIDVAKKKFLEYTFPARMAILLHEYSHFNVNKDASDEEEADKHAMEMYLSLGYPRIDALNVFGRVLEGNPSEANVQRFEKLRSLIEQFENNNPRATY